MKINKNSLQARINNLSKEKGVHANVLLVSFFFDAFISRLAKSKYAENFVFKGGFYLATLLGVQNRYPVTPSDIEYSYRSLIGGETIAFRAYNLETVIAEKLQTILARGILNSRCKDFYDIYIIRRLQWDNVDKEYLKKAFEETCGYRKTTFSKYSATEIIEQLASNGILRSRWANYAKKSSFARDVSFDATIHACRLVIETAVT